ncbi:MAG: peptidoglycan DD-metalloendopeptidase family protein [Deltaproteobacteria bacterium]|nr:peptidoglycan DD-metalloendopeptidase family protein [Deltaproteobacteria bacterium]
MNTLASRNLGQFTAQSALAKKAESLSGAAAGSDALQRQKAAQEFASFLYLEVLKAMRAALPHDGSLDGESLSRDIYTSMMDAEIAQLMARRDVTGFTAMVGKSLDKIAPGGPARSLPPVVLQDEIQVPVQGVVSSLFGSRADPFSGATKFHHGADIAAPSGTAIKAAAAGKVVFSGQLAGYGNLLEVDHGNGWVTRYGHNAANLVSLGDEIVAGQPIALVGSTGRSTGAHLHFEVRRAGKPVNPEMLLGGVAKGSKLRSVA